MKSRFALNIEKIPEGWEVRRDLLEIIACANCPLILTNRSSFRTAVPERRNAWSRRSGVVQFTPYKLNV